MADVDLRIVDDPARVSEIRTDDMRSALAAKPDLVFLGNTGKTPVATYRRWGTEGLDLSRLRLRMLDAYLISPTRGVGAPDHPGCFTRFVADEILGALDPDKRPRDWTIPAEDVTTCEEVAQGLEQQPDAWDRLRHPVTGEPGSEFVIHEEAGGPLAMIRRTCAAYERLLARETIEIASLGVGPLPYPHMAFNTGPYTRPDAPTHLALLDDASRRANAADFGGDPDNVPPFALTAGPATILRARTIWITALGTAKSEPVARALSDPGAADFEFRSSIGYALRAARVSLVLDEDAARTACVDGGLDGLVARYAAAGHRLVARRV